MITILGAGLLGSGFARALRRKGHDVRVWNRTLQRAKRVAAELAGGAFSVEAVSDLEGAIREADIVSCATLASEPLAGVFGAVQPAIPARPVPSAILDDRGTM